MKFQTITTFYPGYSASRQKVALYSRTEFLALMKELYGVPWNVDAMTDDEVRAEALTQHAREWQAPARCD